MPIDIDDLQTEKKIHELAQRMQLGWEEALLIAVQNELERYELESGASLQSGDVQGS